MAGTITVSGMASGLLTGSKVIGPITVTGTSTIGQITDLTPASGDNTIAVPSGTSHVTIEVPSTNTIALKVRTNLNSSDGGFPLGSSGVVVLPIATGVTSLILNAASQASTQIEASFI